MMRLAIVSTSLLAFISLTAVAAEEVEVTQAWTRATASGSTKRLR